jgi:hypothetical protein
VVLSGLLIMCASNLYAQDSFASERGILLPGNELLAFNEEYDYARNTKEDYLRDTTIEWQGRTLRDMGLAKLAVGGTLLTTGIFFIAAHFDDERDGCFTGGGIGLCLASLVPIYYGFDDLAAARRIHPLSVKNEQSGSSASAGAGRLSPTLGVGPGELLLCLKMAW